MRNCLGVVSCHILILATYAATQNGNLQTVECDKKGGLLVSNTCVCNYGYTGQKCDVTLMYDETEVIEEAGSLPDTNVYIIQSQPSSIERFKRQSEMDGSGGSGEEATSSPVTSPVPPDEKTMTSSNETNTPSGSVMCEFLSETFHNGECVDVLRYSLMLVLNGNFVASFANNTSDEFTDFVSTLVDFIEEEMVGTGLVEVTINQLSNGSIMASGEILFNNLTSHEATFQLQRRLRGSGNSNFDFLAISAQDMNECEDYESLCPGSQCRNTEGSFQCVCGNGTCDNDGECVAMDNNIEICKCPDGFSGPQCRTSIDPWVSGVIALAVILGILLVILIVYLIVICARKWRSKKRSISLPLATGFRSTSEPIVGGFDNPNSVDVEELKAPFPIERMSHATNVRSDAHESRPISMTTFRPEDGAAENAEDNL